MFLLVVVHPSLRRVYNSFFHTSDGRSSVSQNAKTKSDETSRPAAAADSRLKQRVLFDFFFAIAFIAALHGFSTLKILVILYINYNIATRLHRAHIPAATWIFNIGILFANELSHGYPFARIAGFLNWGTSSPGEDAAVVRWGKWLDNYGGLIPRWEILFNITVLRLISFNMDYYWSLDYRLGSPVEVCGLRYLRSIITV